MRYYNNNIPNVIPQVESGEDGVYTTLPYLGKVVRNFNHKISLVIANILLSLFLSHTHTHIWRKHNNQMKYPINLYFSVIDVVHAPKVS